MVPALGIAASLLSDVGYKALKGLFSSKHGAGTTQEGITDQAAATGQNVPARSSRPDLNQLFAKIDGNGDGAISKDEFLAFKQQIDGGLSALLKTQEASATTPATTASTASTDPAATDPLFAKIDANGDGSISKDEFLAFRPGEAGVQNRAQKILSKLDTNHDGSVSKDELLAFVQQLSGASSTTAATATAAADGSSDGATATSAAQSLVDKLMAKLDTNGDGAVSGDELTSVLSHHHGKHHHADPAQTAATASGSTDGSGSGENGTSQAAFLSALLNLQSGATA